MKAAYIEACGTAEAIRYGDLPDPVVCPGTVLVQVTAVAVDPIDTYIRSGAYPLALPFPFILGRDLVGVVREVGAGVTRFQPGDTVWSNNQGYAGRQGTFAELALVEEALLYPLPDGVDPEQAVAVLHSALTAVTGLFGKARLTAGETLFVNGGSGNVGLAVLQMARASGARVAVTAGGADKAAWCRENGADRVIDYHHEDVTAALKAFAPQGLDIYWEATRDLSLEQVLDVVAPGGRIVVMAGLGRTCDFPVGPFYTHNLSMYGFTITSLTPEQLARAARQINGWLSHGCLRARVEATLPLSEAAEAHRRMDAGKVAGKLILKI